jgi:hypothetical protein
MTATIHTITIGNKRRNDRGIYIGRPSALGNPFVIGRDGDRAAVIRKYEAWLAEQIKSAKSAASIELRRLVQQAAQRDICLVCWCAPEPCHGDIVKRAIEQLLTQAGT